MPRLTASKLDLAFECLHWATLDVEDKPNAAGEFGTRFHALAAAYVLGNPLPFEPEPELKTMFEAWVRNERKRRPAEPLKAEPAYALTLQGDGLELGQMLERDYSAAPEWAICGTTDLTGADKFIDYKTGKERFAPHDSWQLRFGAAVTDLSRGEFHYIGRSGRTTVKAAEFTAGERAEYRAQLVQLGRRFRNGDTAPTPGNHCDTMYCPARKVCAAYREACGLEAPKQAQEKHMSRMTLSNVVKGRLAEPHRVLLYGTEGIGKSTFGADSPSPIFLASERGTAELDVARFPEPENWTDVFAALESLHGEHEYGTLVIDTVDWLEPLCHAHVCAEKNWTSVDDPAYGAGYNVALAEWRKLIAELERLQDARKMHLILLGHSHTRAHRHPELDDFDRFELAINKKAAALLKQWCRTVLFADYETETYEAKGAKRTRAISDGSRYVHTSWRAAFDAKNRCGLPPKLPLGWAEFEAACGQGAPATADDLRQQLTELLATAAPDYRTKAAAHVANAGNDARKLSEILDRVKARITNQQEVAA